jgi:hypothetical protein
MIQNLFNLVKENANELIVNNPVIDNKNKDDAISETGNVIVDVLRKEISAGNISGLTQILKSNGILTTNPIINSMIEKLGLSLSSKFNLEPEKSNQIASQLIPKVMEQLIIKTNDPDDDSFTPNGLLNDIGGDGIGGIILNLFGSKGNTGKEGGLSSFFKKFIP